MRANGEDASAALARRRRASEALMETRRHDAARGDLEDRITRTLAERSLGRGIGRVWADAYAEGWRACRAELFRE